MDFTDPYGDPINPRKAGGREPGGGGFNPPGGTGLGPGGGFGGGGFFGAERGAPGGDFFGASARWPKRRVVMGPNGPVPVSYSPMTADTVPAMLSPGEGVLNNGAMAEPGMQDFLSAANQRGVAKMAEGGMVQGSDMVDANEIREALRMLLPLLLGTGGGQEPGEVQGFAWGGMVRPQMGGQAASARMASRTPQMPAAGQMGASAGSGGGGFQTGPLGRNRRWTGGAPVGPGLGTGPVPDNPWGNDPFAPGSQNPGDEQMARLWKMLQGFGDFGSFSPEGSKGVMDAVGREATSNADALRRRSALNADVQGLDAGQRGAYAMQSDLNTQGDVANILSNAQREQLLGQQQFGQNMLGKFSDANMQAWLAKLASWMKGG